MSHIVNKNVTNFFTKRTRINNTENMHINDIYMCHFHKLIFKQTHGRIETNIIIKNRKHKATQCYHPLINHAIKYLWEKSTAVS